MIRFLRKSLVRQLILGVSIVHAILMTLFVSDFVVQHNRYLEKQFIHTSMEYARLIAHSSVHWVLSSDFVGLEEVVNNAKTENINFVEIINRYGKVLANSTNNNVRDYVSDKDSLKMLTKKKAYLYFKNENQTVVTVPIRLNREIIGWVRLSNNNSVLRAGTKSLVREGVVFVILAIVTGAFLSWLLIRGVTTDLRKITELTTTLREKFSNKRLNLKRHDELQILAENFNSLMDTIQQDQVDMEKVKNRLDLALDGAGLGIWDWDFATDQVLFDDRWAKMLGLDINDLEMNIKTWEDRVHPDDLKECYNKIELYKSGESDMYESVHRMMHADGHWVYILDKGRFSEFDSDGKPIRFTGTHLDITASHKAYDSKISELNDLFTSTPSSLCVMDENKNIVELNKQGREIFGVSEEDLQTKLCAVNFVVKEDQEKFIAFNQQIQAGERGTLVFRVVDKEGEQKYLETYAAPFRLRTRKTGLICLTNDITQKIKREEEAAKQKQLSIHQAKLASIGALASGVGHEINNPLTIVRGYVDSMREELKSEFKELYPQFKHRLEKIILSIDRIEKIVKGLRTFSRSDEVKQQEFDIIDCVYESVDMVEDIYRNEGINVVKNIPEGNFFVKGSRGQLQQVLINLLSNAKDVVQTVDDKEISVMVAVHNSKIELRVSDTGRGIPEEIIDQIFDPFFTTKEVNQGTGIGLSLAFNYIKEMQGEIVIDKSDNHGTTFLITLPGKFKSLGRTKEPHLTQTEVKANF